MTFGRNDLAFAVAGGNGIGKSRLYGIGTYFALLVDCQKTYLESFGTCGITVYDPFDCLFAGFFR